jgi:hypothetical protein
MVWTMEFVTLDHILLQHSNQKSQGEMSGGHAGCGNSMTRNSSTLSSTSRTYEFYNSLNELSLLEFHYFGDGHLISSKTKSQNTGYSG